MFLARFTKIRFTSQILYSSVSLLPFSTQTFDVMNSNDKNPKKNETNIKEGYVLDQLSLLLPIRHRNTSSIEKPSSELELGQLNENQETLLSSSDEKPSSDLESGQLSENQEMLLSSSDEKPSSDSELEFAQLNQNQKMILPPSVEKRSSALELSQLYRNQKMILSPEDTLRGIFIQKLIGKDAVKRALTEVSIDIKVNRDLIYKVVNRGYLNGKSMVLLLEWAIEHRKVAEDVASYNVVFKALGKRKFFDFMMNLLSDMRTKGLKPNYDTLYIFMDSFVKARQLSKALHMFVKLEQYGMEYDVYYLKAMLRCLCKRSKVAAASALLKKMKKKMPYDVETYNIVISGWAKFSKVNEIKSVMKEMVKDGLEPDSLTFSYVLEGLGRNGQIDKAVKIFENMKEKKIYVMNTAIYNAMIFNFISTGDIDESLKYYEAMLRNNCEPNIDTYVRIISAFLKVRRVVDALEMFDEMLGRDVMPTTETITQFIKTLCSGGPPDAAMTIYKKAKDAECTISASAYKLLLMRLSRSGKCGTLLKIWNEMEQCGYASDVEVYGYIINGLINIHQLDNAVVMMEECMKKGFCPDRHIWGKLRDKLLRSNKARMAFKLFLKVKNMRRKKRTLMRCKRRGWHC